MRPVAVYTGMVGIPVAVVVAVLAFGRQDAPAAPGAQIPPSPDPFLGLLVLLPLVVVACAVVGRLMVRIGQPPVVGEIAVGLVLGPSVLGAVWPAATQWLMPAHLTPTANAVGQLGLVLFMFLVGYEMDLGAVGRRGGSLLLVSHVGVAVPFLSGVLLAAALYDRYAGGPVGFVAFAMFLGVSMSITAFPVLARILAEKGMERSEVGAMALSSAAVDDVTAWCLLAVVVATLQGAATGGAGVTVVLTVLYFGVVMIVVRPLLRRWARPEDEGGRSEQAVLLVVAVGVLLSALVTSVIGAHAIFGAFLIGVAAPRRSAAVRRASGTLRSVTVTLLLPLFFVHTGLRTDITLLGVDAGQWLLCALVIAVATAGKWVGVTLAARIGGGFGWSDALSLGALMNCRGLTELVILGIGLELGVIDQTLYTMMVIMTLLTTALTSPALDGIARLTRRRARTELTTI